MPKRRPRIHPFGTYYLHGYGKPRRVGILQIGHPQGEHLIKIRDGEIVHLVTPDKLHPSPKPRQVDTAEMAR